jgi:hypothetical protein
VRDTDDPAHPLLLIIEFRVPQKTANESRYFLLCDSCHRDAVSGVPQVWHIKACVPREERRIATLAQQDDNLFVLQAFAAKVEADLPDGQPPCVEQQTLSFKNVFGTLGESRAPIIRRVLVQVRTRELCTGRNDRGMPDSPTRLLRRWRPC